MRVNSNGSLQNLYWGGPLWRIENVPAAAPRDMPSFDLRQMLETEEPPAGEVQAITNHP